MIESKSIDPARKDLHPENPIPEKPQNPGPMNPEPPPEEPGQDIREVEIPPAPQGPHKVGP